ncbi:MAG: hydrogenase maturation protease [Planctomycetota bacterium]
MAIESWERCLAERLRPGTVIIGVGNPLRGDDAAGTLLARRLEDRVPLHVENAGVAPENFVVKISALHPRQVVFVDAVCFDAEPGAVAWFAPGELEGADVSCHAASLALCAALLEEETGAVTSVLAIRPEACRLGEPLSAPVAAAVERVAQAIETALRAPCPENQPPQRRQGKP